MAEINLLKQKKGGLNIWQNLIKVIARVLMLAALAVVLYYGWLFLKQNKLNTQISDTRQKIASDQQEVLGLNKRDELYARQAQLKELDKLASKHTYFSQLLPELAKVTLKTSSYTSIKLTADGSMVLSAIVPDIQALDKLIQVFDYPKFYDNFSNVRVGALNKIQQGNSTSYKVELQMKYNPGLIQYKAQTTK